jgi:hypothetical protein
MAYTKVSDAVVPSVFTPYMQALTEVKSKLVQSGALVRDPAIDALLAGGGLTFDMPGWDDLADTAANQSTDDDTSAITPINIGSRQEIGVRISRNQAWGAADLVTALAGDDPMQRIAARVAPYWTRQAQLAVLATLSGVVKDNTDNDSGDYTVDITGTYQKGVTDFSASAFIDACHTMGDSESDLGIVLMHPVVYAKAKKNNLIDFVQDSSNPGAAKIATFLGRRVMDDDGMPVATQDYTTYILGAGALRWGVGTPKVPIAMDRDELAADGGGIERLISRVEWLIHPTGHKYAGTAPNGGPTNAATTNNLDIATSWDRVANERKQVKIAVLKTTEA